MTAIFETAKCVTKGVPTDGGGTILSTGLSSSHFLFLAKGNGRFYDLPRAPGWLEKAGFVDIEVTRLPATEAVFLARKG